MLLRDYGSLGRGGLSEDIFSAWLTMFMGTTVGKKCCRRKRLCFVGKRSYIIFNSGVSSVVLVSKALSCHHLSKPCQLVSKESVESDD